MLPRQKKPARARRPPVVPTDLPVFDVLQDAGLVVVTSEKIEKLLDGKKRKDTRPRK